jgi:hypothetical protein
MRQAATRYAGTNSGTVAALRLAVIHLQSRRMAEAISVLQATLPKADKKVFGTEIHRTIAAALSDSGQYVQSADEYLTAAGLASLESVARPLRLEAAHVLAQAGEKARAIAILEEIVASGDSDGEIVRGAARVLLGELTAVPAQVGGSPG